MNRMTSAINLRRRDNQQHDHDIDNDMVDMLDVIGRYTTLDRSTALITNRSRGICFDDFE